jgi:predicted TIM-barrel fold metal-dependent hydrolase
MRAIDAWVNVDMPPIPASWQKQAAQQFSRPADEVFRELSISELLDMMDGAGVEKAILTVRAARPSRRVLGFADQHPDRFSLSALLDPRTGMRCLRTLESVARDHPVKMARVIPCTIDVAPSDRIYYPSYAKCVELGLPISINTGIPGPPLPGRCQDPMHLDDVCLYFPELVIIMAHGADPWWDVAVRLLLKYPNLYLMTSAFAPKYLPASLLHFMNTRGKNKVMFATDYPFLMMSRCLTEAAKLDLLPEVLDGYLYGNAGRVLFGAGAGAGAGEESDESQ